MIRGEKVKICVLSGCMLIGAVMVVLRLKQLLDGGAAAGVRVEYLHGGLLLSCSHGVDHLLGDVLHGLHELLLVHLGFLDVRWDNHAAARVLQVELVRRDAHRLPHHLDVAQILATVHRGISIVELLRPCLGHRCHDLVANLDRSFVLKSDLMSLLHLVDLRLLLLHDFGQLKLVLQL